MSAHDRDWKVGSGEVEHLHVAPVSPVWKTELYFLVSDYKDGGVHGLRHRKR